MGYCICEKSSGLIESYSKWDQLNHNSSTHVQVVVDEKPDKEMQRWNGVAFRPATTQELSDSDSIKKDAEAQRLMESPAAAAMMEEFIDILSSAGISLPADVPASIQLRIKDKL